MIVVFSFRPGHILIFYHTVPTLIDLVELPFKKTLLEKKKMLVTSIFSFCHNVFYPSQSKFQFFSHIHLLSADALNSDQSKILLFGKELCPEPSFTNSVCKIRDLRIGFSITVGESNTIVTA